MELETKSARAFGILKTWSIKKGNVQRVILLNQHHRFNSYSDKALQNKFIMDFMNWPMFPEKQLFCEFPHTCPMGIYNFPELLH